MQNNSHYIAALIKRQWIREELVASDLFTIDVLDEDFVGGYKPMVLQMGTFRDFLLEELSFISLPDTPGAYTGFAGNVPVVNNGENGLEFIPYIDNFLELTDTPIDYAGANSYQVVVNAAGTGLEFIPQPILPVVTPLFDARLNYNGATNPSVSLQLTNTLGVTITFTRQSLGKFRGTFSTPVSPAKLIARVSNTASGTFHVSAYSSNYFEFTHRDFTGVTSDPTTSSSIEVKLYP